MFQGRLYAAQCTQSPTSFFTSSEDFNLIQYRNTSSSEENIVNSEQKVISLLQSPHLGSEGLNIFPPRHSFFFLPNSSHQSISST